ncbi:MAG: gliding motility-associated C-terminal domain-containing protein [Bacteroidota bacterium]
MNLLKYFYCLLLLALLPLGLRATHITGADLIYECVNPTTNTYRIRLTMYRDCVNGQAPFDNSVRLYVFRGSNNSLYTTQVIPFNGNTVEVIPVYWDACTGAPYNLCIEYAVYEALITLPPAFGGYNIGWSRCCRNNVVTNIFGQQGITVLAKVPGTEVGGVCNNMPTFNDLPPVFLCVGAQFNFDNSATDVDGDSLAYAISDPYTGLNFQGFGTTAMNPVIGPGNPLGPPPYQNINFLPGYNFLDPFQSGNFSIDPQSGLLQLTPTQTGLSVFAVSVLEYRNGVLISENKRDFQINVINCAPQGQEPVIGSNLAPVPNTSADTIFVDPTQPFCYNITVNDPEAMDTVVLFPVSAVFGIGGTLPPPYATLSYTGTNPAQGQVCWTPSCDYEGDTISIVVGGRDTSDCPGYNIVFDTTYVVVRDIIPPTISHTLPGPSNDSIFVDPGESFCYTLQGNDAEVGDNLSFVPLDGPFNGLGGIPPFATIAANGNNPISGNVCWTAPCDQGGTTVQFIIAVEDDSPCSFQDYDTVTVVIAPNPVVDAGADAVICFGETTQLNASGGVSYSWTPTAGLSNPNIQNPSASPTTTTTYTAFITDQYGCVWQDTIRVTVNQLPLVDAGLDQILCPGGNVQLQATGAVTYVWTPATGLSNANIANPIATPTDTTLYTVTGTDANGCVNTDQVTVTPMQAIASQDVAICIGDTVTISAIGGTTYSWDNAGSLGSPNSATTTAFPTVTTTYTVTVTDPNGCVDTDVITVTVNPLPPVNAGLDQTICVGLSANLQATGALTYQWFPTTALSNPNIANPVASPTGPIRYYVVGTDGNGCSNIDSIDIDFFPQPVPTVSNDTAKCGQVGVPLQAGGGVAYAWTPVLGLDDPNIANPIANPDSSTLYTVNVTDANGCTDSVSVFVRVMHANAGPDIDLCIFDTTMLSASGGVSYVWDPSPDLINPNGPMPTVFPTVTSEFYVTATDTTGCTDRDTVVVTVNPLPVTTATTTDPWVCSGGATTFNATGGVEYAWFPGQYFADSTLASPTAFPTWVNGYQSAMIDTVITYYVMVTDANGCQSLDSVQQTVRKTPLVVATNDTFHCPGGSVQLNSAGGVQFEWTNGQFLSADNIPNPIASVDTTTIFQVKVTAVWGCADSTDVLVYHINPQAGIDQTICAEDTIPLLATGGVTYAWDNPATLDDPNIANPMAFPLVTTQYVVTVTDSVGCVDTDTLDIFVNPLPPADAGPDLEICIFDTAQLVATGGIAYEWLVTDSLSDPFSPNPTAHPRQTTTYVVRVTDANGCQETDTVVLVVHPLPIADVGPDITKCGEDSIQLQATGGVLYNWAPATALSNPNIANPMAEPDSNITYVVTVTDQFGCVNYDTLNIQTMYADAGPDQIKCPEDSVLFGASTIGGMAAAYSWDNAGTLSDPNIADPFAFPTITTTYVVSITDTSGCVDTDTTLLTVYAPPPVNAGPDFETCIFTEAQLQGSGGAVYSWTPAATLNDSTLANPITNTLVSTEFILTVIDTNGCVASDSVFLTVNPLPIVEAGPDQEICRRDEATLSASGATSYQWTPEQSISNPLSGTTQAFPQFTTLYTVLGTDDNGCQNTDSMTVTVWQLDTIQGDDYAEICIGQGITLSVDGAASYEWNTGELDNDIAVSPAFSTEYWVIPYEENGCPGDTFFIDLYVERNLPIAELRPDPQEGFYPLVVNFENLSRNATNYFWDFGDDSTSMEINPTHTYNLPGQYIVTLVADNDIGCPTTIEYSFIDAWDFEIFFPTAFSPNNDGYNDEYKIVMNSIEFFNIKIYDRWGQVVFEANDPQFGWDGNKNGRAVPEGVYTYVVDARTFKGDPIRRGGTITLIR